MPLIDEWWGLADLLANMIEKYAAVLDIDSLPEPPKYYEKEVVYKDSPEPIENPNAA